MDPIAIVVEWGVCRRKKRKEEIESFFHLEHVQPVASSSSIDRCTDSSYNP
jgi:hypothetical protein